MLMLRVFRRSRPVVRAPGQIVIRSISWILPDPTVCIGCARSVPNTACIGYVGSGHNRAYIGCARRIHSTACVGRARSTHSTSCVGCARRPGIHSTACTGCTRSARNASCIGRARRLRDRAGSRSRALRKNGRSCPHQIKDWALGLGGRLGQHRSALCGLRHARHSATWRRRRGTSRGRPGRRSGHTRGLCWSDDSGLCRSCPRGFRARNSRRSSGVRLTHGLGLFRSSPRPCRACLDEHSRRVRRNHDLGLLLSSPRRRRACLDDNCCGIRLTCDLSLLRSGSRRRRAGFDDNSCGVNWAGDPGLLRRSSRRPLACLNENSHGVCWSSGLTLCRSSPRSLRTRSSKPGSGCAIGTWRDTGGSGRRTVSWSGRARQRSSRDSRVCIHSMFGDLGKSFGQCHQAGDGCRGTGEDSGRTARGR